MSKAYRLKIIKVPLEESITYKRPNFPTFDKLYLEYLENPEKLKKNPPKPLFIYNEPSVPSQSEKLVVPDRDERDVEDFTLDELERAYANNESEKVFSDIEESEDDSESSGHYNPPPKEYKKEDFQQESEEEIDEEERERNEKADLLFKFMVLRRQYPNVDIPEFTDHSDILTMKRVYDQIIRQVSLDSSIDNYKRYLWGGFLVFEFVATNWIGIDLTGFSSSQQRHMNSYDRLLIELGEKNYSPMGSRFPVELRLLGLIAFNAALFYMQKTMFSGNGGLNLLNAFSGQQPQQSQQQSQQQSRSVPRPRRRMAGPTLTPQDVDDILMKNSGSDSDDDDDDS